MFTLSATLCFTAVLLNQCISVLTAGKVMKNQGENVTIVCKAQEGLWDSLSLIARLPEFHEILYYDNSTQTKSFSKDYKLRVSVSGTFDRLEVIIRGLQQTDSGFFFCEYNNHGIRKKMESDSLLLIVKEKVSAVTAEASTTEKKSNSEMLVLVSILTACTVVILCVLVTVVWIIPKVKAMCARQRDDGSRSYNSVYEDMRAHRTGVKN